MPATAHAATGGGVACTREPTVAAVACVKNCASKQRMQGGSTAKLTGQNLGSVTKVVFKGSGTRGAAKAATVKSHSSATVVVSVPIDAQTGPVQALASGGVQSRPSKTVKILPAPPVEAQSELTPAPGAPSLETAPRPRSSSSG